MYTPSSLYSRISPLVLPGGKTAAHHAVHTVKRIIRRLKSHLHKGIGTKPMTRHKYLPKTLKLQRLTIILANQVTQSRLRKAHARAKFQAEVPFQLLGHSVNRVGRVRGMR